MAELRIEELTAQTIVAARNLALKPGQAAFIAPGKRADLVVLDPGLGVREVIRGGAAIDGGPRVISTSR